MTRKTYIGIPHRDSISGQSLVTVCNGQKSAPLPLRLDLFNHSPTGFSWGYGGSGPAQLALALLADALGHDDLAVRLHQAFKFRCRMPLGQSQCIPQADPGGRVSPRF